MSNKTSYPYGSSNKVDALGDNRESQQSEMLERGMKSKEQEKQEKEQTRTISFGQVDLLVAQDGSAAVCQFSLLGIFEQNIVIPRPVVLQFLKKWVENEKLLQDINRVVRNIPGSRND